MKIYMCVDVDPNDIALLLMLARQENMPLDALIKIAISQYVMLKLASPSTRTEKTG